MSAAFSELACLFLDYARKHHDKFEGYNANSETGTNLSFSKTVSDFFSTTELSVSAKPGDFKHDLAQNSVFTQKAPDNQHLRSKYSSMCQDEVIMEEEALSESKKNTPRTIIKKEKKSKAKKAHLSVINELNKIEN